MEEGCKEISEESFFVNGYKDASSYSQEALRSILVATKSSNDLPAAGDDFDYYSTFPGFREVLFQQRQHILSLMTSVIQSHGIRDKFQGRESDEKFDLLVEANDVILENVSTYLDEASGLKKSEDELVIAVKPPSTINTSWNKKQFNSHNLQNIKLLTAKNVSRPQLSFKDKIDNTNSIFVPIIKEKPHSIKPHAVIYEHDKDEFCHPYEWEIEKFTPSEEHLQVVEPVFPEPLEETPFEVIKTDEQLKKLCEDLSEEKDFAVDLEHHSYRSFQGFTCLMQISTRKKDYIVDVFDLRSEMHILNEVFANPKIVKVLHGADMDVLWLQRDFGIYIVNLFDTGQAARVLHFAHASLAYLVKHYCKLDLDKRYQLADWRIRPLPAEMLKYAREDTHYLLYVYDCIKNDLLKAGNEMKNLLHSTFDRSKVICAKRYQKPLLTDDKYLELYKNSRKMFNAKQLYCLKELYEWRDRIARDDDESIAYVLPNHMMLQIAEALPREQQGILACCNPIPPLVKQQLNELHSIILKANETSLKQMNLHQKSQTSRITKNQIDLNSLIHCPHDIHHLEDKKVQSANQSGNAENLLPLITERQSSSSLLKKKPILSALFKKVPEKVKCSTSEKIPEEVVNLIKKLISPFERYKVTEQIQPKVSETINVSEDKNDEQVEQNAAANDSLDSSIIKEKNAEENNDHEDVSEMSSPNTPHYINESTPLSKWKKKRKRKAMPDISLAHTPNSNNPPPSKKSRTPEVVVIDDDKFEPYDYSKADCSNFVGQKKAKNKDKFGNKGNRGSKRYYGKKKKNIKQGTYGKESGKGRSSQWPKNK
ncbi:hypothetical protein NPIL_472231 [Nephila pilipes]|uniref:Exosome complex component 10 homolog n=1 Tax=Nephila pilipes TaxID=299642 RepID=A0A8X6MSW4_NEPPI|nr:hypothetical protein NPIL_472231 [Nephila pilipes]